MLADVGGMRWGDFKPRLADALVAHLQPIQQRYAEVMRDEGALDAILAQVSKRVPGRGVALKEEKRELCCTYNVLKGDKHMREVHHIKEHK